MEIESTREPQVQGPLPDFRCDTDVAMWLPARKEDQ
jgi:hypothetical protein